MGQSPSERASGNPFSASCNPAVPVTGAHRTRSGGGPAYEACGPGTGCYSPVRCELWPARMNTTRIAIEPELLGWARQAIGMGKKTAAQRLGISKSTLGKWESGTLRPTIKQLRKAASVYRVPLAVLLLPEPPTTYQPIRDYRRLVDGRIAPVSPALHAELRRAESQREVFLEFSVLAPDSVGDTTPLPKLTIDMSTEEAGRLLRSYIGVSLQLQRSWQNPNEALNGWVDAVEGRGILVVHVGRVPIDEVRGFSVSELPFPVVGLNGADWPRPRVFTLFHELAHIALNVGGLCDLHESKLSPSREADYLEHFCNAVAVAAIVPADDLLTSTAVSRSSDNYQWSVNELKVLADRYMVSSEALLLRLVSLKKASWDLYWSRKRELEMIYEGAREERKRRQRDSEGGPSYYRVKARDIGHTYAHAVLDAYRSHAISSLDVADYLHVKYNQISKLESVLR